MKVASYLNRVVLFFKKKFLLEATLTFQMILFLLKIFVQYPRKGFTLWVLKKYCESIPTE